MPGRDQFAGKTEGSVVSLVADDFASLPFRFPEASLFVAIGGAVFQSPRETVILVPKLRL
jgi:hypothetical protein